MVVKIWIPASAGMTVWRLHWIDSLEAVSVRRKNAGAVGLLADGAGGLGYRSLEPEFFAGSFFLLFSGTSCIFLAGVSFDASLSAGV